MVRVSRHNCGQTLCLSHGCGIRPPFRDPLGALAKQVPFVNWGRRKANKQKTHKHISDGPCGTIVPGTNPHSSQGQTGQNGDFTVEFNRKRPACLRDKSQVVPREGSRLSQKRFLFVPDTVPAKMFMFIGFFLVRVKFAF